MLKMFDILLDNHVLIGSLGLFAVVYSIGYMWIFKTWAGRQRCDAAGCGMSLLHGAAVAYLATWDVLFTMWMLDGRNTPRQNRIMEFSIAYFMMDILNYFLTAPEDCLFIGHHMATLTYMVSCRYYTGHGAASVMRLIAAGEITSPMQNLWTLARMAREGSPLARHMYRYLSPIFTILFTVIRGVIGPYLVWALGRFYIVGKADAVVPRCMAYSWLFKVTFAVCGSMVWVYKLWVGFFKFYKKESARWRLHFRSGFCNIYSSKIQ